MKILESYIVLKSTNKAQLKELTVRVKSSSLQKNAARQRKVNFDNRLVNTLDANLNKAAKVNFQSNRAAKQKEQRRAKRKGIVL